MKNKPNNAYIFCSGFECFLVIRYQNEFYSIELDTFQTDKMTKDEARKELLETLEEYCHDKGYNLQVFAGKAVEEQCAKKACRQLSQHA